MNKSIKLTEGQWESLQQRLKEDYKLSTVIMREKMKCVLGFLPRFETQYGGRHRTIIIHLDFFDERKRTMFMLKYSEYLENKLLTKH